MDRRNFIKYSGAAVAASSLVPSASFAAAPTEKRLIVIILRGGLDSLHALAPYADSEYSRVRPTLALSGPSEEGGVIDLNGYFGLHPALAGLHDLFQKKEALLLPASSTRYRNRSHFDAQNLLENGSGKPFGIKDGWLNRAISGIGGGSRRLGLALGPVVPLILLGKEGVQSWSKSKLPEVDEDFLVRLSSLYQKDPLFAKAYKNARGGFKPNVDMDGLQSLRRKEKDILFASRAAAELLRAPKGPRIAVMEMQGWDTHFGQSWRLDKLFQLYSKSLGELKAGLGSEWLNTAVVTVSEFGRTVAENGSKGTDHGTGGLAILAGGAVNGGRIIGKWPGLAEGALYEGRDLRPVNSHEGLFKGVLVQHLGLKDSFVEEVVFPDSSAVPGLEGVFRSNS